MEVAILVTVVRLGILLICNLGYFQLTFGGMGLCSLCSFMVPYTYGAFGFILLYFHLLSLFITLLHSVDLDVGSLGSTENIQTIFELLPSYVEHARWNNRDHIPNLPDRVFRSSRPLTGVRNTLYSYLT
jgi:hypothetical protein